MTYFRVTPNLFTAQAIRYAQAHSTELSRLQEQASSGLRVNRPSDDPQAARALTISRADLGRLTANLSNVAAARARLNQSAVHLQDAQNIFVRAQDIALTAQQSTEPSELQTLAGEVDQLLSRLVATANAKHEGQAVFGGTAVDRQPFAGGNGAAAIRYQGAADRLAIPVGSGLTIDAVYSGAEVFGPMARQATVYVGSTGAQAGSGTDSGVGRATLQVQHTATTYSPGSGVQTGTSSTSGDTILGPAGAHQLTITDTSGTGAFGTISLNGGPAVAYTSGDTNLQVVGLHGESVYLNTTAITAGFSGTVDITADGTLSTDGGLTTAPIDFSGNQAVVDSQTGAVTYVNSTGIRAAGSEQLEYDGTGDAFQVLQALRDELRNTRHLSSGDWHAAITRRLGDVQRIQDHLLDVIGEQSVSLEQLDAVEQRTQDLHLEMQSAIGDRESADISQVALGLTQQQTALQFTLATAARIFDVSLLDYLR